MIQRAWHRAGDGGGSARTALRPVGRAGTSDIRQILATNSGDRADLALSVFTYRLRASIAAMTASVEGIDALAFTGGLGERAPEVRRRAAAGLFYIGLELDATRNTRATEGGDTDISSASARVRTLVIHAREDIQIAAQTHSLIE